MDYNLFNSIPITPYFCLKREHNTILGFSLSQVQGWALVLEMGCDDDYDVYDDGDDDDVYDDNGCDDDGDNDYDDVDDYNDGDYDDGNDGDYDNVMLMTMRVMKMIMMLITMMMR